VSAVPIPQLHYRRMRPATFGGRPPREGALRVPVEHRQLPRFRHRRLRLLGGHPRRGGDRLRGPDDRARRGAPAQHRRRPEWQNQGIGARSSRTWCRSRAIGLPDRVPRGAARPISPRVHLSIRKMGFQQMPSVPSKYYPAPSGR
jgi:hypothetical protein